MCALKKYSLNPIVHGSIARGDVNPQSDIDVVIPYTIPPFLVEQALADSGFNVIYREIVQATPAHAVKAYIYISEREVVSLPLTHLSYLEREFYRFGGELDFESLKSDLRVPGVDKRLMIIIPTKTGHREYSIIGREAEVAQILKVSIDIVFEREKMLMKRREVGRTGVFLKVSVPPFKSIEEVFEDIISAGRIKTRRLE